MNRPCLLALLLVLASTLVAEAQELEPRRGSHLPTGTNFHGAGYAFADGDLSLDPVLKIEDVTFEIHTVGLKYIRTFDLFGRSARIDLAGAYQDGTWKGKIDGVAARAKRSGWADPVMRFAVNLYGAPPLEGEEFASYRAEQERETIVGAGLAVHFPLGEYFDDKLINLGSNRFTIRPQLGVVHNRGKWGFELTGSAWIYTDNDDFFGGKKLEQDPYYTIQGHIVYNFRPTMWIAGGLAYGIGKDSTIDGEDKDDRKHNLLFGFSAGYAITRNFGVKAGYLGKRALADTGADFDSFIVGATFFWSE